MERDYVQYVVVSSVDKSDGWLSISTESGTGFGLDTKYGVVPEVGDTITLYTVGSSFGTVRGMDLNGVPIFYKTDTDLENARTEWLQKEEERKQKAFADSKSTLDAQYEALPTVFKKRIDRFRNNNKRFRVDYQSYELFCCEQGILIANKCKTPEEVDAFSKKEYKEQKEQIAELSEDHSGNTFGCSVQLAYWYLKEPNMVYKLHGALTPLVGSDAYGDFPLPED